MKDKEFSGYGGKRPLLYIPYEKLYLDPNNPRLPEEIQGKDEPKIKEALKKFFYLDELALSMSKNGYFDEEPLVAIPNNLPKKFETKSYDELKNNIEYLNFIEDPETEFTVVEGNRRLCTVKLLMGNEVSSFPEIGEEIREDLKNLPVIIYPKRKDVIFYLGVRHIVGVKKWDAYAKARYIASMKDDFGLSLDEIQDSVGDTSNSARKTYACYKLIDIMEEEYENYDTSKAKENFSYLLLGLGQGVIKEFLGFPKQWSKVDVDNPVGSEKMDNLFLFFSWLFGEGKEKKNVIEESRDITGKLTTVLKDEEAIQYLIDYRDLNEAFERSGGQNLLLLKYLKRANRDLSRCLSLVELYYNEESDVQVKEAERLIESIKKLKK